MPVSREESGGVEGLRAWVSDAAERVKRLLPGVLAAGPPSLRAIEASVAELDQLSGLLDHDEELRGSVRVWLAGALTLRHANGGGTPADRERAEALLRDARDRSTPLGAVVAEEERRWAALFLISHVSPIQPQEGSYGGAPDLSGYLDWLARAGPAGMLTAATEMRELMDDVARLPLRAEMLGPVSRVQDVLSAPSMQGVSDMMAAMVPAGSPFADQLRQVMDRVFAGAGGFDGGRPHGGTTPPGPPRQPEPEPEPEPEPARKPTSAPDPVPVPEPEAVPAPASEPEPVPEPTLAPDDFRNMVRALDAVNATSEGLDPVLRSGDPQALNDLLGKLRSAQDVPLPGPNQTSALEGLRALLLGISPAVGGTRQDMSAGRAHLGTVLDHLGAISGSLPQGLGDPVVLGRALEIGSRAMEAREAEDLPALHGLVAQAEALGAAVPESDPLRFAVDGALGAALGALGAATRDREALLRALPYLEQAVNRAKASGLPFADELPAAWTGDLGLIRAALAGEPAASVSEHVPPPPDAPMEDLYASTLSLGVRFGLDRDPAVLDVMIGELERLRDGIREGRAPRVAADALWHLAEAYHLRGLLGKDSDPAPGTDSGALEAAEEALTALAGDVLLQAGAEHGLLAARTGASRGVRAARMAASYGRLHEAVAALELGRALVLQAASTSAAVPELLEAAGRQDLAEAWREAADGARDAGGTAADGRGPGDAGEVPGLLPSTLRRQALDALGYRRDHGLLGTPTLSELADGLSDAGADVLLYLVPGDGQGPGLMIAVGPLLGAGAGALPRLTDDENGPLARYVEAAAARDLNRYDDAAARAWEDALEELCDWAFQALGPALGGIEERLAAAREGRDDEDRPLRVVLVPCGRLGVVPWHAARLPAEAAHERLCQVAVISYAASGGQFLRTAARARRDPVAAPVVVADPMMDLGFSDMEVTALRDAFYPHALLCGTLYGEEELPPATPDAVLGFLSDGTSLLHVVSHGSAGPRPTVSALDLAADEKGTPAPLTVTRLLDRKEQHDGPDGPLVVLSACQTDLSKGDHDEALTLTTAFAAAGARDVVGSRWLAQDSGSALLMAVFHHYLVVDGLSPVDALRAAQLWMLDPHRENPGSLRGDLLREMGRTGLERTALWGAFIHQGHPGPGATNTTNTNTANTANTNTANTNTAETDAAEGTA
ncbi:CHAT domain-containing protein [Streptomyces sp. NPDC004126]|uniref:CHAT domain-containing protein n=1 Tax=Streptomyces sp. NPDC004126 TaxID=3390695 RepID=UPI003D04E093